MGRIADGTDRHRSDRRADWEVGDTAGWETGAAGGGIGLLMRGAAKKRALDDPVKMFVLHRLTNGKWRRGDGRWEMRRMGVVGMDVSRPFGTNVHMCSWCSTQN